MRALSTGAARAPIVPEVAVVVSCEHGGNAVPDAYRAAFAACPRELLESHRGWDPGAADVARAIAERLGARLFVAEHTRLLVDLNRSPSHPRLFSELTRALPRDERLRIVANFYRPYRDAVENEIMGAAARGAIALHVSSHSFVPVLAGRARRAHAALLYDPRRTAETAFAAAWRRALTDIAPREWVIRRNYPYRGSADGFTTYLRKRLGDGAYLGLELEVNQALVGRADWAAHVRLLADALAEALERWRTRAHTTGSMA
ncbi:MAG: N-formylglutamate amidohydrolase [Gammaproteobacteria bacterium]